MSLGDIASVATLVLFIFYFIGRVWVIIKEKVLIRETFGFENIGFDEEPSEERENYYDINGGGEIISITSEVPILWLKVIPIQYSDNWVDITPKRATPIIEHKEIIKSNCPIFFRTNIPEGFPTYKIRLCRFDYIMVSFDIAYNGRSGGMAPANYQISHTLRSYLYYLLK